MSFLEKNLAAMGRWCPRSGEAVRAARVPEGFERTRGTDGVETYLRVHQEPRRLEWLGATSMPSGSAAAMVAGLQVGTAGGANGLGLSIGTGYEWKAYVEKLKEAQAVFVWEPEAAVARMALEICDLSGELGAGKIVLLVGEDADEELAGFLREHLGYEVPTVLHPLASLMGDRRNELAKAGEAMVRRAVTERAALMNELVARMPTIENRKSKIENILVAFVQGERYPGEKPVRGELARLGVGEPIRLDHFASCSLALRLKVLAEKKPGKIVGDYFRGQLGFVPEGAVVETWVPPVVGAGYWQKERFVGIAKGDRVVVHSAVHRELLDGMGVSGIEVRSQKPEAGNENTKLDTRNVKQKVAVVADLADCSIEALGIVLPTHQAVYAAAREIVEGEYLTVHFHSAGDVLRRAMARAGVSSSDEGLKEPMLRMIRDVLIPTVPLLTLAGELKKGDLEVELVGEWPGERAQWDVDWREVAVLVHLSPWGVVSPKVLQAAAIGVAIVGVRHESDKWEGSLAKILRDRYERLEAGQLMGRVKGLARSLQKGRAGT